MSKIPAPKIQEKKVAAKKNLTGENAFGSSLRELRKTLGMTQKAFAMKIGKTQILLTRLETGYHQPSYQTLRQIIIAFRVDPKIFFPDLFALDFMKRD